jgi:GntR family transcriptional regulator, transcriptional repressor for pyruvate dehydrogenase complex
MKDFCFYICQTNHTNMINLKLTNQQVTLVDQVEDILISYFKKKDLRPGDPIPNEHELAEALGVGRSVLREALSRLRMLGMVESRPRRGMTLREPPILGGLKRVVDPRILGDQALFNLLGLRVALEIGISGMIFQNLNNKYIEELENIVDRGVVFANNEYTPVSEYEFHAKLYEITGNATITEFQEIIYPVSHFLKDKFKDLFEPINKELMKNGLVITHKDLLQFIKKGDRLGFQKAMEAHFAPYSRFLKNQINSAT